MKRFFYLLIIGITLSLITIACGDNNTTVTKKDCNDSCDKTWQVCDEVTQKCEPKEGFCAEDKDCASESEPKCNTETHLCVADKCSDNPCKDNTEAGNTVCKLDDSEEGYSCICEEGYELKMKNV